MKKLLRFLSLFLSLLGWARFTRAEALPVPSLATVLNPDGTLRPGARGSFDARQFRLQTDRAGRPVFRPAGVAGAGDEGWQPGFGLPNGVTGAVSAVALAGTDLYVGGNFTTAGAVGARRLAKWNGSTWSALGPSAANGVDGQVYALAVAPNGDLYVGGSFTQAGNTAAANVARWNGSTWSSLGAGLTNPGSTYNWVTALAVTAGGDVYATGIFTRAGAAGANNVARWNGSTWSALGTGLTGSNTTNAPIGFALAVAPNGDLYAGGNFTQAGSVTTSGVARWNGSTWSSLGAGVGAGMPTNYTPIVAALAVTAGGDVYAGGSFTQAGGVAANGIARWNGTAWSSLGTGLTQSYTSAPPQGAALAVAPNGDVYASGNFRQAGGVAAVNGIARWDGSAWSALTTGLGGAVTLLAPALAVTGTGGLVVGGNFTLAGGAAANGVARWNGTAWSGLGTGQSTGLWGLPGNYSALIAVRALVEAPNGDVYAGGNFQQAGGTAAANVARWNGSTWSSLGAGVEGYIFTMAVAPNGDLYVGGYFAVAGGSAANGVARWNGTTWSTLGSFNSLAGGVEALAVAPNGDVYVGGNFQQAGGVTVNGLARWNGSTWSSLGTGLTLSSGSTGVVYALAVAANGDLYVGGNFQQAGGVAARSVARWNGSTWSPLGTGLSSSGGWASRLAVAPNGDVYVGGNFSQAGGVAVNNLARWNGSAWSDLGGGLLGSVNALTVVPSGDLYVGGSFQQAGGVAARNVARWNGSTWSPLGTGLDDAAGAILRGPAGKVYVGGYFTAVGDGSRAMACLGLYDPNYALAATAARATASASLFPNPARGTVTLRLPPGAPHPPLVLLDAQGRVVRRYPAPAGPEVTLDVQGLPAGLYVVQCGQLTWRLLVE